MSCGCPITHCGVAIEVDRRTGVIVWCVTGPLGPREKGFKDIGYYIAEGYEGLIAETRSEVAIGRRYFFQPRRCMLQWRHSGLVNYMNRAGTASGAAGRPVDRITRAFCRRGLTVSTTCSILKRESDFRTSNERMTWARST